MLFFYHLFQCGHPVPVSHPQDSGHSPSAYPLISEASTICCSCSPSAIVVRFQNQSTDDSRWFIGWRPHIWSDLISCLFLVIFAHYLEGVTENPQSTVAFNRQERIQKTNFDAKNEFRFFFMLFFKWVFWYLPVFLFGHLFSFLVESER